TITVLFADLSGFTALSEQLDPEVMQSLQNEVFEELTAAVQNFGGFVDKFIGDAMLALFGAPHAHEDDPERALHAALEMVRRAARVSAVWQARTGSALALHIGVNTGPVVAGGIGAGDARAYSVTGDTVNTAQRLQALAGPGEALVGPLAYRLTRHAFAYDSLGAVALRGKAGAVLVHRLVGPLEEPRPARGLEALGLNAPMIGREAELARLLSCLDAACRGGAQLVRLSGEAGIGKSRLVNEFLSRIRDDARFAEVAVRRIACSSLGEQSYGALAAVVRSAAGIGPKDAPKETRGKLADLLAELRLPADESERLTPLLFYVLGLGESDIALRHVEPEQLRRQILFATRTIFERRLALAPLLVVVEDLHWADSVSLEVLRFLIDRLERSRLMVLVTHRPTFAADHFDACRTGLTALRLAPLGPAEGRRLLAELFGPGGRDIARDISRRILERAGGNPLFVEEIVRGLIEVGALTREGAHWRIADREAAADIPVNIHAMLLARMDRLPYEARRLAQEAAVIGPRFDAALLETISADPAKMEAGLDLLCDAEIVEEVAGGSSMSPQAYRFTQTMLHDVIYQNLLVQRRAEMHARIGDVLERLYGERPGRLEDLAMLGHHFSLTDAKTKGARYLTAAGDRARETYANDDAIRLYRQALAALTSAGEFGAERLALCERIADLCAPSGQRE
ncbi:MAG: AAA family ATPase, partial [Alphaproteobacteria bacterium]|nr:AAA family ATPase [Alphaproteobacteria bacterium]